MGIMAPWDGNESGNAGLGPLARAVSSLELWMKAQLQCEPWDFDPSCHPMPWNAKEAERTTEKLVIGIIRDDGVVEPTPPVTVSNILIW
jgi:amidase